MLVVVDRNIPEAERAFAPFGSVRCVEGRTLARNDLRGAEALIVRSVTRVDRELLRDTPVQFVGTATIGIDHLDLPTLDSLGIAWASAPGSNARSVMEYVVAALLELRERGDVELRGARLGVIGVGAVGSLVVGAARALGLEAIPYDPPRERRNPLFHSASLDEVLDVDLLTLHVPFTRSGPDPTAHLVDRHLLAQLRSGALLLNTSRGGVVSSPDLLAALEGGSLGGAVLDVWEGEPEVPVELIERTTIATPHIAGYAHDAKVRATWVLAREMGRHFGIPIDDEPSTADAGTITLSPSADPLDAVATAVRAAYDINRDNAELRALLLLDPSARRTGFDVLRRSYPPRREFGAWSVAGAEGAAASILHSLGFKLA